jgi:cytochrome c oxidase subunit 1
LIHLQEQGLEVQLHPFFFLVSYWSLRLRALSQAAQCPNHKRLATYYLFSAILFGVSATLFSVLLRFELYTSGNRIIPFENQNFYNLSITLHGLFMIFFVVMPGLYGAFGNYFLPVFLGSPEVAFPRVNSFSFLLLPVSYGFVILSTASEFGAAVGWTLYPPLSTSLMSLSPAAVDLIIDGLVISGISSLFSSLNFLATIVAYGILGSSFPLFTAAILITAILLILTLPVLSAALLILLSDLHFNTIYFNPAFGGDPVLYQHFFWFFGHPEVYILIIPAFGIISEGISLFTQKIILAFESMILAMLCLSVLGSGVWAHHIYTIGLEVDTRAYFTAVTIMISLPTGTKVFNWLCSYLGNSMNINGITSIKWMILFLLTFTLGGSTGVILANAATDLALHDTYYVVAHFHFVLSLGAIIALFSSLILYQKVIFASEFSFYSNTLFHFFLSFIAVIMTFTPMHFLGFNVMPRRISDFPDNFNSWNYVSSVGSVLTVSLLAGR